MKRKLLRVFVLLLALVGLGFCISLFRVHLTVYAGGVSEGLFCGQAGILSCDSVASHASSWLWGLPLAVWGMAFYLVVAALGLAALLLRGEERKTLYACAGSASALAFAFDLYLAWVMVSVIGKICTSCAVTYAVNLGLAVSCWSLWRGATGRVAWSQLWPAWRGLAGGIEADYYRNVFKAGGLVLTAAVVALAFLLARTPLNEVRAYGDKEIAAFHDRLEHATQDLPMAYFGGQPAIGPDRGVVELALVGDFQCSHCRSIANAIEELRREWPDKIRVWFVNSPIDSKCNPKIDPEYGHEHACWLARAGECAVGQGKFWEYHTFLYRTLALTQAQQSTVLARLEEIGLDRDAFLTCMSSDASQTAVADDIALCERGGLTVTPSIVINGFVKRGTMFPWMLRQIVESLIASSSAADSARGVARVGRADTERSGRERGDAARSSSDYGGTEHGDAARGRGEGGGTTRGDAELGRATRGGAERVDAAGRRGEHAHGAAQQH